MALFRIVSAHMINALDSIMTLQGRLAMHADYLVKAPYIHRAYKRRDTFHGIKCHASLTYRGCYVQLWRGGRMVAEKQPRGRWLNC